MQAARKTVLEALALCVVGVIVAFTANAVRGGSSESIKLSRNYFDRGLNHHSAAPVAGDTKTTDARDAESFPVTEVVQSEAPAAAQPDHPYKVLTFEEVADIFQDPQTVAGANIFVDARGDDAYKEGHIPGAIQADHYRLEDYMDTLLDYAESAEKIIVYCAGGKCEDSVFLCSDLAEFDISCDRIHVYAGGWSEWLAKQMPVAKGD